MKWLLLVFFPISLQATTLVNPFACKRPARPATAQTNNVLGDVALVGIIGSKDDWQAVVQCDDQVHTLRVGERLGDIELSDICATQVRVLYKNNELVLTVKDE